MQASFHKARANFGSSGALDDFNYTWDANGNLTQRGNYATGGVTENFTYDAVDRMTSAATVSGSTTAVGYDNYGNITSKTGVGTYTYGGPRPHAVTAIGSNNYTYDANGNVRSGGGRSYTWSSYNMPLKLNNGSGSSTFEYGPNNEKIRQVIQPSSGVATTTDYVGGGLFEAIYSGSTTTYKNYIVGPTGTVAIETQSSTQSDSVVYLHHDNLGSVVAITDSAGGVVQKLSYDAFGNSSITQTGSGLSGNQSTLGYTEHVELYNLGLVHMNGRVYDPIRGRFLSPDPNVQSPSNLQSYNRYSYVWNNPLTYTDPSGFFLSGLGHFWSHNWRTFAAISVEVAAVYLGPEAFPLLNPSTLAALGGFAAGEIQSNGSLQGGVVGSLTAGSFATIGSGFDENPAKLSSIEVGAKIALHGVVGGLSSVAQGGSFGSGFLSAALPESVALGTGDYGRFGDSPWNSGEKIVTAAAIGGTASVIGGGKLANGAITGAFSEAYNEGVEALKARLALTDLEQAVKFKYGFSAGLKLDVSVFGSQGLQVGLGADIGSGIYSDFTFSKEGSGFYADWSVSFPKFNVLGTNISPATFGLSGQTSFSGVTTYGNTQQGSVSLSQYNKITFQDPSTISFSATVIFVKASVGLNVDKVRQAYEDLIGDH